MRRFLVFAVIAGASPVTQLRAQQVSTSSNEVVLASAGEFGQPRFAAGDSAAPGRPDPSSPDRDGVSLIFRGLRARGVVFAADLVEDASVSLSGGKAGEGVGRALIHASVAFDFDTMLGLRGGSAFASLHLHRGGLGSDLTGGLQAPSGIDAEPFDGLAELWYQQAFAGDRIRIRTGQLDAGSDFSVLASAAPFLSVGGSYTVTMIGLPTEPDAAPGATLWLAPRGWLSAGFGVYRGSFVLRPDNRAAHIAPFAIGELAGTWSHDGKAGRAMFGYWKHFGYAETLDDGWSHGPSGWYAAIEQRVTGEADSGGTSGITLFARYGAGPSRVADIKGHFTSGFVMDSPFGLDGHASGAMISRMEPQSSPTSGSSRSEINLEAFYSLPLLGNLSVTPDLQYLLSPGAEARVRDAVTASLRIALIL